MDYMNAKEAAEKWGISQRRVAVLCTENRIEGAEMLGNMWLIPKDAEKPQDGRSLRYVDNKKIKPFVKWAGGKSQLLDNIRAKFPSEFGGTINKYAEPFVGGGAVLFEVLLHTNVNQVFINDSNKDLMNCFEQIRDNVKPLIELLESMEKEYLPLEMEDRKAYYYKKRTLYNNLKFNESKDMAVARAACFLFLNKTCFNGLYRVNRHGLFNVPMGAYKNPTICDTENLLGVSSALQNVEICCGNFDCLDKFIDENTLVYFDPPYRPLKPTSNFTSYNMDEFKDEDQLKLAEYCHSLSARGVKIILSNSDPKNVDENDNFFDDLYADFNIQRVKAVRMINSKSAGRGKIFELLITNY